MSLKEHKDILLIFGAAITFFFLFFWGIRIAVGKAFNRQPKIDHTQSQDNQTEIHRRIQETKERQDDLMDQQKQKMKDFEYQQKEQRRRMEDMQQRMRDMQRR